MGFGIELKLEMEYLEIVNVIENGFVGEVGFCGGDWIVVIDNIVVVEIGGDVVVDCLWGFEGSLVDLLIDLINGDW